jgi:uncharacterized protein (DUF1697 family)
MPMARYVAFLRGINLGGRRISNDDLRAVFEGFELTGVATFRASGNVVFDPPDGVGEEEVATKIEVGLAASLGYDVPVFLRSCEQVAEIAARGPFPAKAIEASAGKLQVAMLPDAPGKLVRREALGLATDEDRLAIEGSELYWLPSGGMSESDLDLKTLESKLGPWTMRTMGTIEQIAAKHCRG